MLQVQGPHATAEVSLSLVLHLSMLACTRSLLRWFATLLLQLSQQPPTRSDLAAGVHGLLVENLGVEAWTLDRGGNGGEGRSMDGAACWHCRQAENPGLPVDCQWQTWAPPPQVLRCPITAGTTAYAWRPHTSPAAYETQGMG